jgi:hypothetical protein
VKPTLLDRLRHFLLQILLSAEDRRLRTAWRIMLHWLLLQVLAAFLVLAYLMVFGPPSEALDFTQPLFIYIQLVAISLATWIARRFFDQRSFISLGLQIDRKALLDSLFGFGLSALMMGLIFLFEWGLGWLKLENQVVNRSFSVAVLPALLSALLGFIAVGFYEELMSRGYYLQNLIEGSNLPWGLFLSSAIFSLLHLPNPNSSILSIIGLLASGYFLAYAWLRTGQLWLAIGLHIGWNFFEGPIFGFPVSGLDRSVLIFHTVDGPQWITGGAFGPEAGLVSLLAMGLGAFLIWLYTRKRFPAPPNKPIAMVATTEE